MKQNTHLGIDSELVGVVKEIGEGRAVVELLGTARMAADGRGLVHGGFTFALADYAAMVAVNDPNVVLGGANIKFTRPVTVGQTMIAEATVLSAEGKKRVLKTVVKVGDAVVLDGEMTAFVLPKHVLDM
jgi:uncharacterized protein (TIGR00369 family)